MIEDLNITNVYQEKTAECRIDIGFKVKDYSYYLVVGLNDHGLFQPVTIRHLSEETCTFCQKGNLLGRDCKVFEPHKILLFQRLIEMPDIRLEWLFIPHEEKSLKECNQYQDG